MPNEKTNPRTWQFSNEDALDVLETSAVEKVSNINAVLNNKLSFPFRVTLSGQVLTIAASEIQMVKSDGAGGTTNSYKVVTAPLFNNYLTFNQSTLDLSTGVTTGSLESPATCPTVPALNYIWVGIEARDDAQLHLSWGDASPTIVGAKYPVFNNGTAICLLLLQADVTGVTSGLWLHFNTPVQSNLKIFRGSGGGGGGLGGGQGADLATIAYYARVSDTFSDGNLLDLSYSTGHYNSTAKKVDLNYDATQTFTVVGNNLTLGGTPSFTVAIGDIVTTDYLKHTRITTVTTQTNFTVEDGSVLASGSGLISQVLQPYELTAGFGSAVDKTRVVDQLDLTSEILDEALVSYLDSAIEALGVTPDISYSLCSNSTISSPNNWSNLNTRPDGFTEVEQYTIIPNASNKMYARFIANKTSGSGIVSVESASIYFVKRADVGNRVLGWTAARYDYATTTWYIAGSGSPTLSIVGGVTQLYLDFLYDRFSNKNAAKTQLFVKLNGQEVFQQMAPVITGDFCYIPVDNYTIKFNRNLVSTATSDVEVVVYLMDAVSFDFSQLSDRIGILEELDMSWIPHQNGVWDLGSSSYHWKTIYINEIGTSLIPKTSILDLGSLASPWRTLYLTNVGTNLIPNGNGTLDLGSSPSNLWRTLYINNIYVTNIGTSLIPNAGNLDLGTLANPWRDLYLAGNTIYLGSTGRLSYSDSTNTFSFKKSLTLAAKINFSDVGLIDNTSSNAVTLKAPTGLVASYNVTMPAALPGSTLPVQMDTSGNLLLQAIQGVPTGSVSDFAGSSAPIGWLLCDGTSYSTTTYATLFAVIGYTFGGGGGSFNVPNAQGRSSIGAGTGSGLSPRTLAATGGEETHTLSVAELASHNHTTDSQGSHSHTTNTTGAHTHTVQLYQNSGGNIPATGGSLAGGAPSTSSAGSHAHTTDTTGSHAHTVSSNGSGTAHNTMAPFIVFNKIIKY